MHPSVSGGVGAVSIGMTSGGGLVMLLIAVLGIGWPIWGAFRWKHGWRTAAIVPIALLVCVTAFGFYESRSNPTSINVVPFLLLLAGVLIAPYMLVVALLNAVASRRRSPAS